MLKFFIIALFSFSPLFTYASIHLSETEQAYLNQKGVLKIGISTLSNMPFWSGNAQLPSGIWHDIALLTKESLNIPIQYVEYPTISQVEQALLNGQVDLVIGYVENSKRLNNFKFTPPLYKNIRVAWVANENHTEDDFKELNWYCIKGTSNCDVLRQQKFKYVTEIDNPHEFYEAIQTNSIDALIDTYEILNFYMTKTHTSNGKMIFSKQFGSFLPSVMFNKESKILDGILTGLVNSWHESKNNKYNEILEKWNFSTFHYQGWQEALCKEKVVKYTVAEEIFPISYWDGVRQKYSGYIHDLMGIISDRSPLKLEYIAPNGRSAEQMLQDGVVDIISVENTALIDLNNYSKSQSYAKLQYVLIETNRNYEHKKYAVLSRRDLIDTQSLDKKFVVLKDKVQLIDKLSRGEITHAYINKNLLESLLLDSNNDVFHVLPEGSYEKLEVGLSMVFRADDLQLQQQLDQILSDFSQRELDVLWLPYSKVVYNWGVDKDKIVTVSLIILVIFLLALVIVLSFIAQLRLGIKRSNDVRHHVESKNKWLNDLIDTIPSMIVICDDSNRLVSCNRKFVEQANLTGVPSSELFNSLLSYVHRYEGCDFNTVVEITGDLPTLTGKYFEVYKSQLSASINSDTSFLIAFYDITTLKETESKLLISNEQALDSIQKQKQFVAVVSHELRTPISAMKGLMQLLSSKSSSKFDSEVLSNAMDSIERLKSIVDDILDFSKLDSKQLKLNERRCNLVTEISPVLRGYETAAREKGLFFNVIWLPSKYILAKTDALRLIQVISNILTNAVKFTSSGSIIVEIKITETEFSFIVRDTGIGMTPKQVSQVCQPFFQADDCIARRYGGTGLGMSIVSSILDSMNGKISIESMIGVGTSISATIPMRIYCFERTITAPALALSDRRAGLWAEALQIPYCFASCGSMEQGNYYPDSLLSLLDQKGIDEDEKRDVVLEPLKGNVLVVEDDKINCFVLENQLKDFGLQPTIVNDGFTALELLSDVSLKFDLIFTDCHMPLIDGYELAQRIRAMGGKHETIPIIAITADNMNLVIEKSRKFKIDDVIFKPYEVEDLHRILSTYLGVTDVAVTSLAAALEDVVDENRVEFINVVIDSMSDMLGELKASQGLEQLKRIAHKLKGAAGAIRVQSIYVLASHLEDNPNDIETTMALIREIEQFLVDVKSAQ